MEITTSATDPFLMSTTCSLTVTKDHPLPLQRMVHSLLQSRR